MGVESETRVLGKKDILREWWLCESEVVRLDFGLKSEDDRESCRVFGTLVASLYDCMKMIRLCLIVEEEREWV